MDDSLWCRVERYHQDLLVGVDPDLEQIVQDSRRAGLPEIQVTSVQGKFLEIMARLLRSQDILEVGTLGGYSTAWLARGMVPDGRLVTLELVPEYAEFARSNLARIGFSEAIEIRVGDAVESLRDLRAEGYRPFDLIFLDGNKAQYPDYLDGVIELSRPGTLIIADNVVRDGAIVHEDSDDPRVLGVREFNRKIAGDLRLSATALQTVGSKGYDGFSMIFVSGE